jgi:hypothetical protein
MSWLNESTRDGDCGVGGDADDGNVHTFSVAAYEGGDDEGEQGDDDGGAAVGGD